MNAIAIGPLIFSTTHVAAFLGLLTFAILAASFARKQDPVIFDWSVTALTGGILAARIGHVIINRATFTEEPVRSF